MIGNTDNTLSAVWISLSNESGGVGVAGQKGSRKLCTFTQRRSRGPPVLQGIAMIQVCAGNWTEMPATLTFSPETSWPGIVTCCLSGSAWGRGCLSANPGWTVCMTCPSTWGSRSSSSGLQWVRPRWQGIRSRGWSLRSGSGASGCLGLRSAGASCCRGETCPGSTGPSTPCR